LLGEQAMPNCFHHKDVTSGIYGSMGKWLWVAVSSLGSCLDFLFPVVKPVSEESLLNFKPQFSLANHDPY